MSCPSADFQKFVSSNWLERETFRRRVHKKVHKWHGQEIEKVEENDVAVA